MSNISLIHFCSLFFLVVFFPTAKHITHCGKKSGRDWIRKALIVAGTVFIGLMLSQLCSIERGERMLGTIFFWFCLHGGPAIIVARSVVALLRQA